MIIALIVYLVGFVAVSIFIGWREPYSEPSLTGTAIALLWFAVLPHGLLLFAGQAIRNTQDRRTP